MSAVTQAGNPRHATSWKSRSAPNACANPTVIAAVLLRSEPDQRYPAMEIGGSEALVADLLTDRVGTGPGGPIAWFGCRRRRLTHSRYALRKLPAQAGIGRRGLAEIIEELNT